VENEKDGKKKKRKGNLFNGGKGKNSGFPLPWKERRRGTGRERGGDRDAGFSLEEGERGAFNHSGGSGKKKFD